MVEALLEDARVNPAFCCAEPLREAARYGHLDIVKLLLANERVRGVLSLSPAPSIAIRRRHYDIADLLLSAASFDPSATNSEIFRTAARFGRTELLTRILADPRVDPSAVDNEAIRDAAANGHAEVVARLLADPRVNPTARNSAALRLAAHNGHSAVIAHLLADRRADPAARGNAALLDAARLGHTEVARLLLADGRADPNAGRGAALCSATQHDILELLDALVADARLTPSALNSALCAAAATGSAAAVSKLLAHPKCDPAARGSLALLMASQHAHVAVVDCLLTDGRADPMARGGAAVSLVGLRGKTGNKRLALQLSSDSAPWKRRGSYTPADESARIAALERLLADPRVDPSVGGGLILRAATAAPAPHSRLVRLLIADARLASALASHSGPLLCSAVLAGDGALLDQLLAHPRIDCLKGGSAALLEAAARGDCVSVARLLQIEGLDLHARCPEEYSDAATTATMHRQWDAVRLLLGHPAYRLPENFRAPTIISWAAELGVLDVLQRCLTHYDNIDPADSGHLSLALSAAARGGCLAVVSYLLDLPTIRLFGEVQNALVEAARCCRLPVFELFIEKGGALAKSASTQALSAVVECERLDDVAAARVIALRLLDYSQPDAWENGKAAAMIVGAAKHGLIEVVERLLADPRVDPAAEGNRALHAAATNGHAAVVACLLADPRVSPVASDRDIIHDAAEKGHVAVARAVLDDARVDRCAGLASLAAASAKVFDCDTLWPLLQDEAPAAGCAELAAARALPAAAAAGHYHIVYELLACKQLRGYVTHAAWADALLQAAAAGHPNLVCWFRCWSIGTEAERADASAKAVCAAAACASPRYTAPAQRPNRGDRPCGTTGQAQAIAQLLRCCILTPPDAMPCVGPAALIGAVRAQHTSAVKALLGDSRVDRRGALCAAAARTDKRIVELLLADRQVDPSAADSAALAFAIRSHSYAIATRLLADGRVDPGPRAGELLWYASSGHLMSADLHILAALLEDPRVDPMAHLWSGPLSAGTVAAGGSVCISADDITPSLRETVGAQRFFEELQREGRRARQCRGDPLLAALSQHASISADFQLPVPHVNPYFDWAALPEKDWPAAATTARLFFRHAVVLNARLRQAEAQPAWLDIMRRVGTSVETLAGRAWRRRAHVVAARQWMLEGNDGPRKPTGSRSASK